MAVTEFAISFLKPHHNEFYMGYSLFVFHFMSQQLGNEVERQGRQVYYTQDSSFFSKKRRRASLGGIRTHDTLQSRRALYQLRRSYLAFPMLTEQTQTCVQEHTYLDLPVIMCRYDDRDDGWQISCSPRAVSRCNSIHLLRGQLSRRLLWTTTEERLLQPSMSLFLCVSIS